MARARSIRNYTDSELVNLMSDDAERTFARLLTVADRDGNLFAHPTKLNKLLFPLKTYRDFQISTWIKELATEHIIPPSKKPTALLHLYEVNGKSYLHINKYGQTHKGEKPIYPPPPEGEVEEEDELESEGETEDERNHHVSSFSKINGNANTEIQNANPANAKPKSKESDLRARTVDNEEWVLQTASILMKPVVQVKSFCNQWIQKKVHLGPTGIDHPKATIENLIKFMFDDLEKQKTAVAPTNTSYVPEKEREIDKSEMNKAYLAFWDRVKKEHAEFKKHGTLQIIGTVHQFTYFQKAGFVKPEELEHWKAEAKKIIVEKKSGGTVLRPDNRQEYHRIKKLSEAIAEGTFTGEQEHHLKVMAMNMLIHDFYNKKSVEEFEGMVGTVLEGMN